MLVQRARSRHQHGKGVSEMRSRDSDKHADGTIESLRTLVNTIKEYALPEYPPNELGQVHFLRVVFESVIAEVEASIARQETDKETADANAKYIAAIPALCRGEEVPCALHVSQPIATLTRERDDLRRECERLRAVVKIATDTLNVSA